MSRSPHDQLMRANVFATVVRAGSFSAASRLLGVGRSTVSEHVSLLEQAVGARLLERTTRKLHLTEEGELLFEAIDQALRAWETAFTAVATQHNEPVGTLRVTCGSGLIASLVAPVIGALVREHERLDVEVVVDDALRDLMQDRIDVALRMAPLQDSSMACRKLGSTTTILVSSPELLEPSIPEAPEQLIETGWVGHSAVPSSVVGVHDPEGTKHSLRPRYRAQGNSSDAQIALVEQGCGVALMPELLVRDALRDGRLIEPFLGWHGRDIPIYAVYRKSEFTRPRVTRFLDSLTARLASLR